MFGEWGLSCSTGTGTGVEVELSIIQGRHDCREGSVRLWLVRSCGCNRPVAVIDMWL